MALHSKTLRFLRGFENVHTGSYFDNRKLSHRAKNIFHSGALLQLHFVFYVNLQVNNKFIDRLKTYTNS